MQLTITGAGRAIDNGRRDVARLSLEDPSPRALARAIRAWAVIHGPPASILLLAPPSELPPLAVPAKDGGGTILSDSLYGDLDGDGIPEIAVGRLVGHPVALRARPRDARRQALVLAFRDATYLEPAGRLCDRLRTQGCRVFHRPADRCDRFDVRTVLLRRRIDLVTYFGHSDERGWLGYAGGIALSQLLPLSRPVGVVLSPTCNTATAGPGGKAFGPEWVNNGYAAAFLGATRVTYTHENHRFVAAVAARLAEGGTLANSIAQGVAELATHATPRILDNLAAYSLSGDPALTL